MSLVTSKEPILGTFKYVLGYFLFIWLTKMEHDIDVLIGLILLTCIRLSNFCLKVIMGYECRDSL